MAEVLEISATGLVGEYVGQTGPKTQKLLEKALSKVLFVDEAYRLAEGHFAKEAVDEIVDCITKPAFAQRLIIILAGYDADINRLMSINSGLTSRFPETVTFRGFNPNECLELFTTLLKRKGHLNIVALASASAAFQQELLHRFGVLTSLANWANARDVDTLAKSVFGQALRTAHPDSSDPILLEETTVLTALEFMITERSKRAKDLGAKPPVQTHFPTQMAAPQTPNAPPPPNAGTQGTQTCQPPPQIENQSPEEHNPKTASADPRDPGVSQEVWARLQLDKQATVARRKHYDELLVRQAELEAEHTRKQKEDEQRLRQEQQRQERLQHRRATAEEAEAIRLAAEEDEIKCRLEQERLRHESERRKREEELARLERERRAEEEERRKEAAAQRKLQTLGVCVAGYHWIKGAGGYRCAGGSHYVSDAQLGLG
ncbi:MAG: hypothetical protein LQ351_000006 [Letrouitia transgressa]|nr:MAG: hypothetical protein LQ351_000006 [Letrouitia transgressa]